MSPPLTDHTWRGKILAQATRHTLNTNLRTVVSHFVVHLMPVTVDQLPVPQPLPPPARIIRRQIWPPSRQTHTSVAMPASPATAAADEPPNITTAF